MLMLNKVDIIDPTSASICPNLGNDIFDIFPSDDSEILNIPKP